MTNPLHRKHTDLPEGSRTEAFAKIEREQAAAETDPKAMAMHRAKQADSSEDLARFTEIEKRSEEE